MDNIKNIQSMLNKYDIDAIFITSESNRQYSTGFHSTAGMTIVCKEEAYFFVDSRYIEAATNAISSAKVEDIGAARNYPIKLNEILNNHGVKKVGFEDEAMTFAEYNGIKAALDAELVPASALLNELRASKNEEEIAVMIEAQRISEKALDAVLKVLSPKVTEKDIAAELTYQMLKLGAEGNSFDPIVVSGPRSSMPHGVPGDNYLVDGSFITMDFGCKYKGYCSDMTRTVALGSATDEMKNIYDIVLKAQLAGIAVAKAGVPGKDIDTAARNVITEAGYGDYFGHSFGHSLGLDIHENPNASQMEPGIMPLNAVVSAEPGIYLPGKFGVRIEDVMILRENKAEVITLAPKDLIIV